MDWTLRGLLIQLISMGTQDGVALGGRGGGDTERRMRSGKSKRGGDSAIV